MKIIIITGSAGLIGSEAVSFFCNQGYTVVGIEEFIFIAIVHGQAFRSGKAAAGLVYRYHLPQRLDMLPFILTLLTLPLAIVAWPYGALIPLFFYAAAFAAVSYNDLFRKGKTVSEWLGSLPALWFYYLRPLAGV